jgi:hypothetical protein
LAVTIAALGATPAAAGPLYYSCVTGEQTDIYRLSDNAFARWSVTGSIGDGWHPQNCSGRARCAFVDNGTTFEVRRGILEYDIGLRISLKTGVLVSWIDDREWTGQCEPIAEPTLP